MEARPGEKGRVPEFAHIWGEEGNLGELEAWGGSLWDLEVSRR